LARETLNAWRWTKIKLALVTSFSAVLLVLWWHQAGGTHFLMAANPIRQTAQASQAGQSTTSPGGPANGVRAAADSSGPQFLLRAVAADTGRGIAGARVLINEVVGADWLRKDDLLTDSNGMCSIPLPTDALGRLDVGILKDGFAEKSYLWREDFGIPLPSVYILKLERAVAVGGHVQDPAGRSVSNAEIGLHFYDVGDASSREPQPEYYGFVADDVTAVKTDADGNWRCALAPPGYTGYGIEVRHPDFVQGSFALGGSGSGTLSLADLLAMKAVLMLKPGVR
jgi:hypothetical protein